MILIVAPARDEHVARCRTRVDAARRSASWIRLILGRDVYAVDRVREPLYSYDVCRWCRSSRNGQQLAFGADNHVMSGNGQYVVFANNGGDTDILPGEMPNRPQPYIANTGLPDVPPKF